MISDQHLNAISMTGPINWRVHRRVTQPAPCYTSNAVHRKARTLRR